MLKKEELVPERMIFWCLELMGLLGLSKTQKPSFELSLKIQENQSLKWISLIENKETRETELHVN